MKKKIKFLICLFVMNSFLFYGCSGTDKKNENDPVQTVKEQYQCPMKCTEELFDKPGKCPVCEMELEKITKG